MMELSSNVHVNKGRKQADVSRDQSLSKLYANSILSHHRVEKFEWISSPTKYPSELA